MQFFKYKMNNTSHMWTKVKGDETKIFEAWYLDNRPTFTFGTVNNWLYTAFLFQYLQKNVLFLYFATLLITKELQRPTQCTYMDVVSSYNDDSPIKRYWPTFKCNIELRLVLCWLLTQQRVETEGIAAACLYGPHHPHLRRRLERDCKRTKVRSSDCKKN